MRAGACGRLVRSYGGERCAVGDSRHDKGPFGQAGLGVAVPRINLEG